MQHRYGDATQVWKTAGVVMMGEFQGGLSSATRSRSEQVDNMPELCAMMFADCLQL